MKLTKEDIQKYGTEDEKTFLKNMENKYNDIVKKYPQLKDKMEYMSRIMSLARNADFKQESHNMNLMAQVIEEIYLMGKKESNQNKIENDELGLP
jgi:hypothetical protein